MRYVQIGCGYSPIKGWANYDYNKFLFLARLPLLRELIYRVGWIPEGYKKFMRKVVEDDIRFANASHRIPEDDNSVDVLYSSHMLEHLDRAETQAFLKEVKRVLVPGGRVRIVVPDFDVLVQNYADSRDPMAFLDESCLVGAKPKTLLKHLQYLIQGHGWHFCMYNADSLAALFESHGFREVTLLPAGETTLTQVEGLDLSAHAGISLYLEAQK